MVKLVHKLQPAIQQRTFGPLCNSRCSTATDECRCFTVACQQWTQQPNTNYLYGLLNTAANVAQCQAACLGNFMCTGFDWDARQHATVGRQCWLSGSWSGTAGSTTDVTHYVLNRNCQGELHLSRVHTGMFVVCTTLL